MTQQHLESILLVEEEKIKDEAEVEVVENIAADIKKVVIINIKVKILIINISTDLIDIKEGKKMMIIINTFIVEDTLLEEVRVHAQVHLLSLHLHLKKEKRSKGKTFLKQRKALSKLEIILKETIG